MTRTLDLAALDQLQIAPDAEHAFVFELDASAATRRELVDAGWFWAAPIARRRDTVFALRVMPGRALDECPVVAVCDGQAYTVVSRPRYFASWLVYPGTVVSADAWESTRREPAAAWDALAVLDRALGGDGSLRAARVLLDDPVMRDAHRIDLRGHSPSYSDVLPDVRATLDPAPETRAHLAYLRAIVVDEAFAAPPECDLGCWAEDAWAAAYAMAEGGDADPEAREWAWRRWRMLWPLDAQRGAVPQWHARSDDAAVLMGNAARRLASSAVPDAWRDDPWWAPALALAADPDGYGGLAHMDAAQTLARAGRAGEAFDALGAAAWWLARRIPGDETVAALAEAARLLARESGWDAALDALPGPG